jgi:hypothetical protein
MGSVSNAGLRPFGDVRASVETAGEACNLGVRAALSHKKRAARVRRV